jgi:chaperone required for assembly of F1-ATPase
MLNQVAKRFYEQAGYEACEKGFHVLLDGRIVNTPLGTAMVVPSQALAARIAEEWQEQGDKIVPATMHMMRHACTAIDKVGPARETIISQMIEYGANDLLCYWAEGPDDLVSRQRMVWQPLLDWAEQTYGASLLTTTGIRHVSQTDETICRLQNAVEDHDDYELTALAEITQLAGSLVLGLAVSAGQLPWIDAFEASQLDETWQNEHWGEDYEAMHRKENRKRDMEKTSDFFSVIRDTL